MHARGLWICTLNKIVISNCYNIISKISSYIKCNNNNNSQLVWHQTEFCMVKFCKFWFVSHPCTIVWDSSMTFWFGFFFCCGKENAEK